MPLVPCAGLGLAWRGRGDPDFPGDSGPQSSLGDVTSGACRALWVRGWARLWPGKAAPLSWVRTSKAGWCRAVVRGPGTMSGQKPAEPTPTAAHSSVNALRFITHWFLFSITAGLDLCKRHSWQVVSSGCFSRRSQPCGTGLSSGRGL